MGVGLTHGTFIRLVAGGTGLSFRTVTAWTAIENGPVDNPLNIGPGNRYGSNVKAAAAVIALLRKDVSNRWGYRDILASAGQKDVTQLSAIANSSWDSSHYESGMRLLNTYNTLFPTGHVTFGPGDIRVRNPVTQIGPAAGLVTGGVGSILGKLASTNTWIRVVLVIVGVVALLAAVGIFVRELR
jgi:hypothetical protein